MSVDPKVVSEDTLTQISALVDDIETAKQHDETEHILYAETCKDASNMVQGKKGKVDMVFCDPLDETGKHACPPAHEIREKGYDLIYTTNPQDPSAGTGGWCVPKVLANVKPANPKPRSEIEQLSELLDVVSDKFANMEEVSSFTWNTPCEDNTTQESCFLMRKPPVVEDGEVSYAKHNTACVWRPWEEPTFNPNESDKPRCVSVDSVDFKRKPLDDETMRTINSNLSMHGIVDQDGGYIPSLETEYGKYAHPRMYISNEHRDIKKGYAQLPLFATAFTLLRVLKALHVQESAFPRIVGSHETAKRKRKHIEFMRVSLKRTNERMHRIIRSMYELGMHVGTYLPAGSEHMRTTGVLAIYATIDKHMGKGNVMLRAHELLVSETLDMKEVRRLVDTHACHVDDMAVANSKAMYEALCEHPTITEIFSVFESSLSSQTVGEYTADGAGGVSSMHFMASVLLPDNFRVDPNNNKWTTMMQSMQKEWTNFVVVAVKRQTVLANKLIRHARAIESKLKHPGTSVFTNGGLQLMAGLMGVPSTWRPRQIPDYADARVIWSRDCKSIDPVTSEDLLGAMRSDTYTKGDFVTSVKNAAFKGVVDEAIDTDASVVHPQQYVILKETPSGLSEGDRLEYETMASEARKQAPIDENAIRKGVPIALKSSTGMALKLEAGGTEGLDRYYHDMQLQNENNLRAGWVLQGKRLCAFPLDRTEYMYTRFDHSKREYGYVDKELRGVHTPKMLITYRRTSALEMVSAVATASCFGNLVPVLRELQSVGLEVNGHAVRWRYNIGSIIHIPTYTELNQPTVDTGEGVLDSVRVMQQIETTSALSDKLLFEDELSDKLRVESALKEQNEFKRTFENQLHNILGVDEQYQFVVKSIPTMLVHGMTPRSIVKLLKEHIHKAFNTIGHRCFKDDPMDIPDSWRGDLPTLLDKPVSDTVVRTREHLALALYYAMRNQFVYVQAKENSDHFRAYVREQVRREILDAIRTQKGAIPRYLDNRDKLSDKQDRLWLSFYNKQTPETFDAFVSDLTDSRIDALRRDIRVPFDTRDPGTDAYHLELNKMLFEDFIRFVYKDPAKSKKAVDVNLGYTLSLTDAQIDQKENEYGDRTWAWMKTARTTAP